jgi:hypothetical protein
MEEPWFLHEQSSIHDWERERKTLRDCETKRLQLSDDWDETETDDDLRQGDSDGHPTDLIVCDDDLPVCVDPIC